jgi:hypothetical protein
MALMWIDPSFIPANPTSRFLYDLLHASASSLGPSNVYAAASFWALCPISYFILRHRSKRMEAMFPGEQDEIFLDIYPVFSNLDEFLSTRNDGFRLSAARSLERAVRTVHDWSHAIKVEGQGISKGNLFTLRETLSQNLKPTISSANLTDIAIARDALARFLVFLLDPSKDDLKSIIRTLRSQEEPSFGNH